MMAEEQGAQQVCRRILFNCIDVYEVVEYCVRSQSRDSLYAGLVRDILAVGDDRMDGDVVLIRDFLVDFALGDTDQNLLLPLTQQTGGLVTVYLSHR